MQRFRQWLEAKSPYEPSSRTEALHTLGLGDNASNAEISKSYRRLSLKYHPDLNRSDTEEFKKVSAAYEFLKNGSDRVQSASYGDSYSSGEDIPEWQPDKRSSYNEIGKDFRNRNFCQYQIWKEAKKYGPVNEWTFWAWDGNYFRGVFSAYANEEVLGFAGKAMETWNSKGANSYDTAAVFASLKSSPRLLHLIRLKGVDVSDEGRTFEYESFNTNPSNDQSFTNQLRSKFRQAS